ncbi:MAG: hypothetical protein WA803_19800, partial [Steroidobacteraceae bacterium]
MSGNDESGCLVLLIAGAAVIWFSTSDSDWVAKLYATNHYDLPSSKVSFEKSRPHDCDFMTAPLGSKHCSYKRDYSVEWLTLSSDKPQRPIIYGTLQEDPPAACSQNEFDFAHKCYYVDMH